MQPDTLAGEHAGLFITLAVIFGLMVGSFLNGVIHRVPKMMQKTWQGEC